MIDQLLHTPLILWLFVAAAIPVNIYPFVYAFRPWRTTAAGRALMVKACGNLILIDMSLAVLIFGPGYPGREQVRTFGMAVFTVGVWYLLIVLLRTPRNSEREEVDHG